MLGHPAGRLTYQHTNSCQLRAHEDGQKVADLDRATGDKDAHYVTAGRQPWGGPGRFQRPATATECTLLASQGLQLPEPPTILLTRLDFWSRGVCRRTWPQLEETS